MIDDERDFEFKPEPVGIQARLNVRGTDYMLVSEHYAELNEWKKRYALALADSRRVSEPLGMTGVQAEWEDQRLHGSITILAPAHASELPRHDDLENPPDFSTLRDDYWKLWDSTRAAHNETKTKP